MPIYKNAASQKLPVYAYDSTTGAAKTGDANNITGKISKNGAASAATSDVNPTELDATNHPGIYLFDLSQAETNTDLIVVSGASSTSNILVDPVTAFTTPGKNTALDVNVLEVIGEAALQQEPDLTISGTVNDASATTTSFVGDSGLSATNNVYVGMYVVPTSGVYAKVPREITAYVGASKTFTTKAFPTALANTTTFIITGRVDVITNFHLGL